LTDINKTPQYRISRKFIWSGRADACGQMDGHNEANRMSSRLCERAQKVSDYSVTYTTFETMNFRMLVYKSPLHLVRSSLEYDTVY
jgi:hypothetical protein